MRRSIRRYTVVFLPQSENISGHYRMADTFIERLSQRVLGHPQDPAAPNPREAPRMSDQTEAERPHAPQGVGVRLLPRPRLGGGQRLELKPAEQVVRGDAELLPGAVPP
jgi:hypothetical protein